jgi:outer membrane protein assembly factor BamE (lipoprotein component of BamABCDE complex)
MYIIQSIKSLSVTAGLCLLLAVSGCAKVDNGGYIREENFKDKVVVGKSSKEDVRTNLGDPSTQSSFGDETWFYITARKEAYAFLKPKIVQQDVTEIAFDSTGHVSKVSNYALADGEQIDIAKRTTPTEGHTMGFMEQILGNLGRFNHATDGNSPTPGRQPGT